MKERKVCSMLLNQKYNIVSYDTINIDLLILLCYSDYRWVGERNGGWGDTQLKGSQRIHTRH